MNTENTNLRPSSRGSHTPGPWVDVSDSGPVKSRKQKAGHQLMALVATVKGATCIDCTGSGENFLQDCANARLIAAAPTMYEFVKQWAEHGNAEAIAILEGIHGSAP